ncbi:MAG TPA: fibronectin type III domain-containing protein [Jatrophihabitans sp.]|nr:fibronectin type III domain-containing protein [Jatrophihabitans sp.]
MAAGNRKTARHLGVVLALITGLALYLPSNASEANVTAGNTAPTSDLSGYAWISYYRSLGGLSAVGRNPIFEAQESMHVRYLANHSLSCETNVHDELVTRQANCGANPYATAGGKAAANNSNITRVNAQVPDRVAVTNWFVSAFHALTLLDPRLRSTGYASYFTPSPTGAQPDAYKFTAGTDVYRGRTGSYNGQTLAFPATGAASPLLSYQVGTESPEPFRSTLASSPCHSWGNLTAVSAPIIMQWPLNSRAAQGPGSIVDLSTGRALPTCSLTASQYPAGSLAKIFLLGTNRVTKAALYYASAPFTAGHRYQLRIAGVPATTFNTSNLPAVPTVRTANLSKAIRVNWSLPSTGNGVVAYYRLTRFVDPECVRPNWTVTTTGNSYTMTNLVSGRWYFAQLAVKNSLGAVRSTRCIILRAR